MSTPDWLARMLALAALVLALVALILAGIGLRHALDVRPGAAAHRGDPPMLRALDAGETATLLEALGDAPRPFAPIPTAEASR